MKIDHYSFGRIIINGKTYTSDVIIFPDIVKPSWWRLEGHLLQIPDLKDIVNAAPSVLIIGTGFYGAMQVPEKTINYLRSMGIDVQVHNSAKAVELYNKIASERHIVAALHLTC